LTFPLKYSIMESTMTLDAALRRAIARAPGSFREMARATGISHVMLAAIAGGRERATPRVAREVARVLERWAVRCTSDAAAVRAALRGHQPRRGK